MQKNSIDEFMLRKQRYKKLQDSKLVPQNTSSRYIVHCLKRTLGFKCNQYAQNSENQQQFIDHETFFRFVKNANKIIDKELIQKAKNQNSSFFCMTSLFLKLSIAIGFLTFTLLSTIVYLDFKPEHENIILTVSIVMIFFSVFIASICPIYLYLRKYKQYNYQTVIYEQLKKLAEEQNQKYKKQGKQYLQWQFQPSFFWIELRIIRQKIKKDQRKFIYRFARDQQHENEHDVVPFSQ